GWNGGGRRGPRRRAMGRLWPPRAAGGGSPAGQGHCRNDPAWPPHDGTRRRVTPGGAANRRRGTAGRRGEGGEGARWCGWGVWLGGLGLTVNVGVVNLEALAAWRLMREVIDGARARVVLV